MASARVLIADDDPIIRLDLKQMLESMGYEVTAEAGDGQQAIELARATRPDVCILDVKMPVMDGVDAATYITSEGIAATVLLTAYSDAELVQRAAEAGVLAYLVKPFKPSDLAPGIEIARRNYDRFRELNKEVGSLSERLESRKVLDRAKGALMEREKISEAEAYRRIQVRAMNSRRSMRQVAEEILRGEAT